MGLSPSKKSASRRNEANEQRNAVTSKTSKTKKFLVPPPASATMSASAADEPTVSHERGDEGVQDSAIIDALSEKARETLRATWCNDFGALYDLGTDIYSEIFRLDPSVKTLFKELDGYDCEKDPMALRQCSAFSKQALRFVQAILMMVQNSGHLHTIEGYLKDIGRRHVQHKQIGFEPSHWSVFETAIGNVMAARAAANTKLSEEERQILADSYLKLSRHIIAVMTVGFREEENQRS